MKYTIYELTLKPLSPWITDLTADTIFGHLCWQIVFHEGKEVLEEFLEEMKKEPIFTISDVLPLEELPLPIFDKNNLSTKDDFKKVKNYDKISFISENTLKEISNLDGVDRDNIGEIRDYILGNNYILGKYDNGYKSSDYIQENVENKNIINRHTGGTQDGGIYSQGNITSGREFRLLLKNISKKDLKNLEIGGNKIDIFKLLKNVFENGYGKKKSSGKGVFEVGEFVEKDFNLPNTKYTLLLSNFIPSNKDSTTGRYDIYTKYPKMGETHSISGQNFYKKPLVMIDKGATFELGEDYKGYTGRMIENVDFENKGIYHYGYGFTLEF